MQRRTFLTATTASLAATQLAGPAYASASPSGSTAGHYEVVARFWGAMPTGVTVSRRGRIFVNFPRWGDDVPFTVAELRGGKPVAYPDAEVNREDA
ncbi:gluconolaconase, partial [Streptomyces sp. NPDC050619]